MSFERVGPYRIEEEVGRGAMGVVFRAVDERLERSVALKALPTSVAQDERRLKRFEREARLLASLNHPNIAQLYALEEIRRPGSDGPERFLVMEWIPGRTLAEVLAQGQLLPAQALELCVQVARGVDAAHGKGVIHRDLKPSNIRVTPQGVAKVLDFGVAKGTSAWDVPAPSDDASLMAWGPGLGSDDGGTIHTGAGRIVGTPGYMAPEQARGLEVDHRSDVWSLGCIVYECLTGQRAFAGESAMDLIAASLSHDPNWAPIRSLGLAGLLELLERALARDRATRLASMGEMLEGLVGIDPSRRSAVPDADAIVGRQIELARVRQALEDSTLVTLVGFGGAGKTRLAREVARVAGGTVVELAEALPADVPAIIARAMQGSEAGVLVLDNAEHAREGVAEMLAQPRSRPVLVTSRSPLGIDGETVLEVGPLELPEDGERRPGVIGRASAVELFVRRLAERQPGFALDAARAPVVARICRRARGLPLAIELAAEQAALMPLEELARRFEESFEVLVGREDRPQRQRTLRALIEWGWALLDDRQRQALARLAALEAPFDVALAAKVLAADEQSTGPGDGGATESAPR